MLSETALTLRVRAGPSPTHPDERSEACSGRRSLHAVKLHCWVQWTRWSRKGHRSSRRVRLTRSAHQRLLFATAALHTIDQGAGATCGGERRRGERRVPRRSD